MLFGVALICCGLNSTVTATMAGQIVMEGFIHIRIVGLGAAADHPRLRHRAGVAGHLSGSAPPQTGKLLILSQVVLSLQLPFAVVPLVMFTASRAKLGDLVAPRWLTVIAAWWSRRWSSRSTSS